MECKLDELALTLSERKELNVFLRDHSKICPDIKKKCDYTLSFKTLLGGASVGVKVKCTSCGKYHSL